VGFEHRGEAERFLIDRRERFARFGLTLHPDKTRLLEFGPLRAANRRGRGEGKLATVHFLGFTHRCAKTRRGGVTVVRQTMRTRWQSRLREVEGQGRTTAASARTHTGLRVGPVGVIGAQARVGDVPRAVEIQRRLG
jgi:hypothetical protein